MDLRFSNLPLRTKFMSIIVTTSTLVVATIFIATMFSLNDLENRYEDATFDGKKMLWDQVVLQQLKELELGIIHLQRNRELLDAIKNEEQKDINDLSSALYNRLSSSSVISNLTIINKNGRTVYTSEKNSVNIESERVKKTLEYSKITSSLIRHSDNEALSAMTVFPLYARGALVGVGVYEKSLKGVIENFKHNDGSEVYIISTKNDFEYATNPELISGISVKLPEANNQKTKHFETISINDKHYTLTRQPIMDDAEKVVAHLISIKDTTDAFNDRLSIELMSFSGIIMALVVSLIGLFTFINFSLNPLNKLMAVVKQLGAGEITVRAEIDSKDEIGLLATAFNSMAQKIQDSIEHERQVAEDIEGKAMLIHEVVEMASHGDLTGEMMVFRDKGVISDLSTSVTEMITNLNNLVTQVQQSGIQVTSSATQIAATAKEQEATITEQAATTNEIVATTKQISATSKELLSTMSSITKVSEQTASSAETGRDALSNMESTMNHMVEASTSITSKLAVLNEKASNINTVVTTITKVADQTNLLSLNAAIEAEKAGEYGVGFSVVATEIRRLADQTAVATWDIEQMVQEMQSAVSAGVMGMDKFSEEIRHGVEDVRKVGSQLAEIIEQVQTILPQFEKVHEGMHSQSLGADQISESMIQLNDAAHQTAESLRQSNDAIARLNDAAQGLQGGISKFSIKTI